MITGILCFIFLLIFIYVSSSCLAELFYRHQRKQERFERQYTILFNEIQMMVQSKVAFDREVLWSKLKRLESLKWKNSEKTKFITMEVLKLCYPPVIEKLDVHSQIVEENKNRL